MVRNNNIWWGTNKLNVTVLPWPGFHVNSHFRFWDWLSNAIVVRAPLLAVPQIRPYRPLDLMVSEARFDA